MIRIHAATIIADLWIVKNLKTFGYFTNMN